MRITLIIVITVALNLLPYAKADSSSLTILTVIHPPFITGDGLGLVEKGVSSAFKNIGSSVNFLYLSRKRAIYEFKKGKYQFSVGVFQNMENGKWKMEIILVPK